jgi:hypothetical protein
VNRLLGEQPGGLELPARGGQLFSHWHLVPAQLLDVAVVREQGEADPLSCLPFPRPAGARRPGVLAPRLAMLLGKIWTPASARPSPRRHGPLLGAAGPPHRPIWGAERWARLHHRLLCLLHLACWPRWGPFLPEG